LITDNFEIRLKVISYQLSVISYQLSAISFPPSTFFAFGKKVIS